MRTIIAQCCTCTVHVNANGKLEVSDHVYFVHPSTDISVDVSVECIAQCCIYTWGMVWRGGYQPRLHYTSLVSWLLFVIIIP